MKREQDEEEEEHEQIPLGPVLRSRQRALIETIEAHDATQTATGTKQTRRQVQARCFAYKCRQAGMGEGGRE